TVQQQGQENSQVQVLIDSTAPNPAVHFSSEPGSSNGWFKASTVHAAIEPTDPGTFGSGVDNMTYSATGATVIGSTTVDEPPVGSPPVTGDVTNEGRTVFKVSATDRAGNPSSGQDFLLK